MSRRVEWFTHEAELESERKATGWICESCITDWIIKCVSSSLMEVKSCAACGTDVKKARSVESIADRISREVPVFYEPSPSGFGLTLAQIIGKSIGCEGDEANELIARYLIGEYADYNDFYKAGITYSRKTAELGVEDLSVSTVLGEWTSYARNLMYEQRYFNQTAMRFFGGLVSQALQAKRPNSPEQAVVNRLVVGARFFRGRITAPNEIEKVSKNPRSELSAPPSDLAADNRMSAAGVSFLYLARELDTCIAEVRPSIGDTVVIGEFSSTRDLVFFDFTRLNEDFEHEAVSLFDKYGPESIKLRFMLRHLHIELSKPAKPGDLGYVVTQALAEYIRFYEAVKFDGIAFSSAQRQGGVNYVIFGRVDSLANQQQVENEKYGVEISNDSVTVHQVDGITYGFSKKSN